MAKETLVLDASVIVKWFCDERQSDIANKLRDDFFSNIYRIIVPDLLFYEVINAVKFSNVFSNKEKISVVHDLYSIGIDFEYPDREIMESALNIAMDYNATIYDSVYLAIARKHRCNYITADADFAGKVKSKDVLLLKDIG